VRTMTAALAALCVLGFSNGQAQDYPVKPVRLVVPFPPGGPLDIAGRLIGQQLAENWKQPVIVENRPGGTLGPESVARATPDGYTLLIISSTPLVTLPQMQKVPYDVLRDLVGVTQTTLLTYALVVHADAGINSVQELIDQAKRAPGRLNYASAGNGSGQHLLVELFKLAAGIDLTHVPFKGAAPASHAVMAGQIPIMLDVTTVALPLVRSGKVKALMVTGAKPLEQLPGAVPFDALFPGVGITAWHGIFTTSGTPAPVLAKLANDIQAALRAPAVGDRFRLLGTEPSGVSGDAFNAIVRRDSERWGEVIRKNNLRAD
jgi:tripartite-type tricarboxylate transporter receptor subunit TctC